MNFTTDYKAIKKLNPTSIRGLARNIALTGLSLKDRLIGNNDILLRPRVQFLYMHHVFDDELVKFENLIKNLLIQHSFISYSEGVQRVLSGNIDKAYIVISSDDGFKNNLKAVEILNRYNIKACFFINPYSIGLDDYEKNKQFCAKQLHFPPTEFMNWNDIESLLKQGHEIGSHTMEHINIAETSLDLVEDDLNKTFEIIKSKCGVAEHYAYPYGRYFHFNNEARELVFKTGFSSCASAERGCHINEGQKIRNKDLLIRRDHVICDWSLDHIMYFISTNAKNNSFEDNFYSF